MPSGQRELAHIRAKGEYFGKSKWKLFKTAGQLSVLGDREKGSRFFGGESGGEDHPVGDR